MGLQKKKSRKTAVRKAWTLTEMFVMLFLLTILILLMRKPSKAIVHSVPYIQADIQTNGLVTNVLGDIRDDVALAVNMTVDTEVVAACDYQPTVMVADDEEISVDPNEVVEEDVTSMVEYADPNITPVDPNVVLVLADAYYCSDDALDDIEDVNELDLVEGEKRFLPPLIEDVNEVEPEITVTTLTVTKSDETVSYRFEKDAVVRTVSSSEGGDVNIFKLPKSKFKVKLWENDQVIYAVEVSAAITRRIEGRWRDTLGNSHVFFVKEKVK